MGRTYATTNDESIYARGTCPGDEHPKSAAVVDKITAHCLLTITSTGESLFAPVSCWRMWGFQLVQSSFTNPCPSVDIHASIRASVLDV